MKRFFTSLTLLTMLLLFGVGQTWAYVKIGGTTLTVGTTYNSSNLSAIKSGTAKLSSATNLELDNLSVSVTSGDAITLSEENLYVSVKGSLTVTNSSSGGGDACLYILNSTTFGGPRGLPFNAVLKNTGNGQAIRVYSTTDKTIRFYGYNLTATAAKSTAIYSVENNSYLNFYYSRATITGPSSAYAIYGFKSVGGTSVLSDAYKFAKGGVVDSNNQLVNEASLYPHIQSGSLYIDDMTDQVYDSDDSGISITSGSFKYDSSTKKLKLDNLVTSSSFDVRGSLEIESTGTCKYSGSSSGFYVSNSGDITFTGTGTLNLNSTSYCGIRCVNGANVTVQMKNLNAYGKSYGLETAGKLTLKRLSSQASDYFFKGESTANLYAGGGLTLTNMGIYSTYTWFNESSKAMYYKNALATASNGGATNFYDSSSSLMTPYDIYVAGTQLNARNAQGFWNQYVKGGEITYDNSSTTLKLDGVTIEGLTGTSDGKSHSAIYSTVDGLTIQTSGTTSLTSAYNTINLGKNTTFTGTSGNFTVTSTSMAGINTFSTANVTLARNCGAIYDMKVYGKTYGFYGMSSYKLTVTPTTNGGDYFFKGDSYDVYTGTLDMPDHAEIYNPYCWYDSSTGYIKFKNNIAKGTDVGDDGVNIYAKAGAYTYYDIYIGGTRLNERNAQGFWNQYVKSGNITGASGNLTLNNAVIDLGSDNVAAISFTSTSASCSLNLYGTNTVKGSPSSYWAVMSKANLTVGGSGSIDIPDDFLRIDGSGKTLTIKNATVKTKRLIGVNGAGALTLDAAKLELSGTSSTSAPTIEGFSSLSLSNTDFAVPQLYTYTSNKLTFDDANWYGKVIVQPLTHYEVYVAGVELNSYNYENIFADPVYKSTYGTSGTAKFIPLQNKLQLSGVNITAPYSKDGVKNSSSSTLTIEFSGTNTLNASGVGNAIYATSGGGNLIVSGTTGAKLNASNTSASYPALYLCSPQVSINGLEISSNGIMGASSGNKLSIDDATINLSGYGQGTISKFASVTLGAGMNYLTPAGAAYDTSAKTLKANGSAVTGEVKIALGDTYPLTIAGVAVNSANASNITGTGISGSVKFNKSTNTLTLNNVNITKTGAIGINSELADLKIELVGSNAISNGDSYSSIYSTANVTITGSGSLTTSFNIQAKGNLTIENTTLTSGGRLRGAATGSSSTLIVDNSHVTVNTSSSMWPITEFGSLVLEGCAITTPAGADFSSADGRLFVGSSEYKGKLVIEPAENLGITVAGVAVTSKNKDNILSPYIKSGKVSLVTTGAHPVLVLDNANIDYSTVDDNPIYVYDKAGDIFVELKGTNTIKTSDRTAFNFKGTNRTYIFRGNGASITSDGYFCRSVDGDCKLEINDANITGQSIYDFSTLTVRNSTLNIKGDNSSGTIERIGQLVLEGCDFTAPVGAKFVESESAVCVEGNIWKGDITIEPMTKYPIEIAGVQVTDKNAAAITGSGITGSISYNHANKRLTFSNANVSYSGSQAVVINDNDIEIVLVGNNAVTCSNHAMMINDCKVKFTSADGTGRLDITSTGWNGIQAHDADVTVQNAIVTIASTAANEAGMRFGKLHIEQGANVKVSGTEKAFEGMAEITYATGMALGWPSQMVTFVDGTLKQDTYIVSAAYFGEDYGFSIGGYSVNSSTLLFGLLNVDYNPSGKVLTLDNDNIGNIVNKNIDNLTLNVSGANTITEGIVTHRPMTINGTGTLTLTANAYVPTFSASADINIKGGVAVTIVGQECAFHGNNMATLHVDNCVVRASATGQVFQAMAGLDLVGVNLSEPANAVFEDGTVKVNGTPVSNDMIVIGESKSYGIDVAGIGITTINAGGVEGTGINSGTVTYDEGTKTLTLSNVDIEGQIALSESVTDIINIRLIGDNKVHMADGKAFYTKEGGFRFYSDGTGTLDVTAAGLNSSAIEAKKAITFENCLVVADGGQRGLSGVTQDCVVTVDNAAVRIRGEQSCVAGMKNIVLANGVQANPTASNKEIRVNPFGTKIEYSASGDVVRNEWIDLSEPYNMWIGDFMLTRASAFKDNTQIATGVNFDKPTRTLRLEAATIDGIWNAGGQALNIIIDGSCIINSSAHGSGTKKPALYAAADVNITANSSTSTLTLDGGTYSPAILGEGEATVTISNHLTVLAKGMKGITSDDKQLTVNIDKSTFMAEVTAQCITGLKALNMTDCGIVTPQGAAFNAASGAVEKSGSAVTQSLVIDPSGAFDAINGIAADDADIDAIYAVDGKKLDKTQTGVNIVRRNDGTVTKVLRK